MKWRVALYDIEGILYPAPDALEIENEEYGAILQSGALERVTIGKLISDTIELQGEDGNEDNLPDLRKLRRRLERCTAIVDDEISPTRTVARWITELNNSGPYNIDARASHRHETAYCCGILA